MRKYNNKIVYVGGLRFDSKKEAERYLFLKDADQRGVISGLSRQVRFRLAPTKITYIADFVYFKDGEQVVEDVKGYLTDVYKIKRELMRALLGIEIKEVKTATAEL